MLSKYFQCPELEITTCACQTLKKITIILKLIPANHKFKGIQSASQTRNLIKLAKFRFEQQTRTGEKDDGGVTLL